MTEMTDQKVEDNAVSGEPQNKRIEDFDPPEKPNANKFAIACATLACMTSILLGYGNHPYTSTVSQISSAKHFFFLSEFFWRVVD